MEDKLIEKHKFTRLYGYYIINIYNNIIKERYRYEERREIEYIMQGEINKIKIFDQNLLIELSNEMRSEDLELLNIEEMNMICKDQESLNKIIKLIGKNIYERTFFSDMEEGVRAEELYERIECERVKKRNILNYNMEIFGYYKYYIIMILSEYYGKIINNKEVYCIIKNPRQEEKNRKGEKFELWIEIVDEESGEIIISKKIMNILKENSEIRESIISNYTNSEIRNYIREQINYMEEIIRRIRKINIDGNLEEEDRRIIRETLHYEIETDKIINNFDLEDLEVGNRKLGDRVIEMIIREDDMEIKIKRSLLTIYLIFENYLLYFKLDEDIEYIRSEEYVNDIVRIYNFYNRISIILGIEIIYLEGKKLIKRKVIDETILNKVKGRIDINKVRRESEKIIKKIYEYSKCKIIREELIDYNMPKREKIITNFYKYIIIVEGNKHPQQYYYYNDIKAKMKEMDKFYDEYFRTARKEDQKKGNIIENFSGYDYTKYVSAITNTIFNNKLIKTDYTDKVKEFENIITKISRQFNDNFFRYNGEDYLYVYRIENDINFGNYNTFLTMSIGKEFCNPYMMSTGIQNITILEKKLIVLRLRLTKISSFVYIPNSDIPDEREILIAPGAILKIIKREKVILNSDRLVEGIYSRESIKEKIIDLIDVEVLGNKLSEYEKYEDFAEYYRNKYITKELNFRINNKNSLICNMESLEGYIKRIYNKLLSKTVPIYYEDDKMNKKFIIKGYFYKKRIGTKTFRDIDDVEHPSNIELKILELTAGILKLEGTPTPHLINSYGKTYGCKMEYFVNYAKKNLCGEIEGNSWLCEDFNKDEYLLEMNWIAMEYAELGNLTKLLNNEIIKTLEELNEIYFQIFYTLAVLFDYYGIVHYDLHSDNILFINDKNYEEGKVKYYKYVYNGEEFYIKVKPYLVKISDYDNSFYNNMDNVNVSSDVNNIRKIDNIPFGKIDVKMLFIKLSENPEIIRKISELTEDIDNNNILKIIELMNNEDVDINKIPFIYEVIKNKRILDIPIFNFTKPPEMTEEEIIKTYTHELRNFYPNLLITPQIHDNIVGSNRLQVSKEYYIDSINKIKILRNNPNKLRIMSYNVNQWKNTELKDKTNEILSDILIVLPDILCLQEFIDINFRSPNDYIYKEFNKLYSKISSCKSSNDLYNVIYINNSISNRILTNSCLNLGNNITNENANKNSSTSISFKFNDNSIMNIYNINLFENNINNETLNNMKNLINHINSICYDKLIIGNFNNYSLSDYSTKIIYNQFINSKKQHINPDSINSLFNVCDYIQSNPSASQNRNKYIDLYDIYLNGKENFFKNNISFIPLNTNIFGGRNNMAFTNKSNNKQILGIYKLYSNINSHSPIIIDFYDPFRNIKTNYLDTIQTYISKSNNHFINPATDSTDFIFDIIKSRLIYVQEPYKLTTPTKSSTSTTPAIGTPAIPAFGTPATPAFGTPATPATPAFGAPAIGAPATPAIPAFGTPATPAFGAPAIGAPAIGAPATPAIPAFGTPATPAFGAPATPAFGAPAFGAPAIGAPATPATPAFGAPVEQKQFIASIPAFGTHPTPAFGTHPTPAFGTHPTPAFGTHPTPAFGTHQTPAFGTPATPAFGAPVEQKQFIASIPAFGTYPTPSFGTPAIGAPAFGTPATPAFGVPVEQKQFIASIPAFGTYPTPSFGTPAIGAPAFGAPAIGTPATPAFGTPVIPAFGAPAFGTPTTEEQKQFIASIPEIGGLVKNVEYKNRYIKYKMKYMILKREYKFKKYIEKQK
jgi:hypothetical protein